MHAEQIKAMIRMRYGTLQAVEIAYSLPKGAIANCLRAPNKAAERAVARALDMRPEVLWPERYDAKTGKRLRPQPPRNYAARFVERAA